MFSSKLHSNLVYVFTETPMNNKVKYTCTVEVAVKRNPQSSVDNNLEIGGLLSVQQQQQLLSDVTSEFKFSGEGMSKKEAKKNCSHIALMGLYPDSYSAPASAFTCTVVIEKQSQAAAKQQQQNALKINQVKLLQQPQSVDLKKRIDKLVNNTEKIKNKTPAQLLHELSLKIAETGKCIQENGPIPEKKFCFQFKNIKDESCVPSDFTAEDIYSDITQGPLDDLTKYAHGFGNLTFLFLFPVEKI